MTTFLGTKFADEHFGEETLMRGFAGNDFLAGTGDLDAVFFGGGGDDEIVGGHSNDMLFGGRGDDFLIGSTGDDRLTGGRGADTFYFNISKSEQGWGVDKIVDFRPGKDSILIDPWLYTNATASYDCKTGFVSVASDDTPSIRIAKIKSGLDISHGDIVFA